MTKIERRKRFIINVLYFVFILLGMYLLIQYAFGLLFPIIFSFFIAIILQKPVRYLSKVTHLGKGLLSAVLVVLVLFGLGYLLYLAGSRLVTEFRGLSAYVVEWLNDPETNLKAMEQAILRTLQSLPQSIGTPISSFVTNLVDSILLRLVDDPAVTEEAAQAATAGGLDLSWLMTPLSGIWNTVKRVPNFFLSVVITIISCVFMTAEYDVVVGFIRRQLPPEKQKGLSRAKQIVFSSLGKLGKSYLIIIFITFCEMVIGLNILKIAGVYAGGYILAVSLIIALVDILPVLGTGTIVIPWAVYSLVTGQFGLGIGLLIIYAIITVARQFIEPKLVANNLGLPSIVTITAMYIGVQLFGFIGLFLLPIAVILIKLLNDEGIISLWKTDPNPPQPPQKREGRWRKQIRKVKNK